LLLHSLVVVSVVIISVNSRWISRMEFSMSNSWGLNCADDIAGVRNCSMVIWKEEKKL